MHVSKAGFGSALKRGMGRAAILLQKEPHDVDLNAELLRACTKMRIPVIAIGWSGRW